MSYMGEVAALLASAFWAFASLLFTRLSQEHGALVMNALKCIVALAMMATTLALLEGTVWPAIQARDTWVLALSGIIGLTIGDTAYFHALTRIGPRRALLLTALVPPTTAILAWPVLGEEITLPMTLGMALTVGGIVWVIRERAPRLPTAELADTSDGRAETLGILFALVAVLCQSGGNVLTKFGGADASAIGISVVRVTAGTLGLFIYLAARGRLPSVLVPLRQSQSLGRLVLATFFGTYLGIWMLNAGLKYTSHTGIAATLSSTSPIFILPLAWIFLGERITTRSATGAVIAVAGVAVLFIF